MYRLMELVEHGDLLGVLEYLRTIGVSNKKVCDLSLKNIAKMFNI